MNEIEGLAVYLKPAQLVDKVNRGDYLAEKTQILTYVFEKPGEYVLPSQSYYWWNLETRSLETIDLEMQPFVVMDTVAANDADETENSKKSWLELSELLTVVASIVGLLMLLVVIKLLLRKFPVIFKRDTPANKQFTEKDLRQQFVTACKTNNSSLAIGLLYRWLDNYGSEEFDGSIRERLRSSNHTQLLS